VAVAHRVYAEALLAAAKEADAVPLVSEEFGDFVAAVDQSDELRNFLRNPQIAAGVKRRALEGLLEGADDRFLNFVRLLAEKNRIGEIADVHREFERLLAAEKRVLQLELTTAVDLSDDDAAKIVAEIEKAAGRKVEATRSVDPSLIGGLVLQAGSVRLDASVRGRLDQLRQQLTTSS
jgi:F-type H+-transporting ATPase subunit delta